MASGRLPFTLANRYLKRLEPKPLAIHLWALPFFLIGALSEIGYRVLTHAAHGNFLQSASRLAWENRLSYCSMGFLTTACWVLLCTVLFRRYTIFTTISILGLFVGSSFLVAVLSVMSGFEQDLKSKILGANAHVLVTATDQSFTNYEEAAKGLAGVKGVESITPYIGNEVMVSSQSNLAGVILKGIDPETVSVVTDIGRNMEQGKLENLSHPENVQAAMPDEEPPPRKGGSLLKELTDKPADKAPDKPQDKAQDKAQADLKKPLAPIHKIVPGILVGRELAKNLRVFLGDDVNVISPMGDIGPTGPMPRSRPFRVVGIFYSGMYEYDTKHIYMSIPAAQKFLGMPDEVTGLELRVKNPDDTGPVVTAVESALKAVAAPPGGDGPIHFTVQDWQELNRSLFSALKIEKIGMFIALCFIILVAGFAIVANGIMLVRAKARDISMLKSMGATDGSILKTFLIMGLYTGGLGIGTGVCTGIAYCMVLRYRGVMLDTDVYYITKLPVQMNPYEILLVLGASMTIALLATLYPALEAARLRPVQGLRYDQG